MEKSRKYGKKLCKIEKKTNGKIEKTREKVM